MLDAFKNMTGGKGKLVQKQTDELETADCHRARGAQRHQRDADRADHAQREADAARQDARAGHREGDRASPTRLDEIAKRLDRARRSHQGARGGRQAHPGAEGVRASRRSRRRRRRSGPDGELQKHREAVQHLSSQALGTQATLDTLKKERADARGAARPAARGRRRSEAVARPGRAR